MIALGEVVNLVQQGWASLGRLQAVYDARASIADPIDPVETPIKGAVEMRGVHVTMSLASLDGKIDEYLALTKHGLNTLELDIKDEEFVRLAGSLHSH